MTTRRRAELQRKLAMKGIPAPPDDLIGRIRNDIPKSLASEPETKRVSRSSAFTLGAAASILIVTSVAIFTITLLEPEEAMVATKGVPASAERVAGGGADVDSVTGQETASPPVAEPGQAASATDSTAQAQPRPVRVAEIADSAAAGRASAEYGSAPSSVNEAEAFAPEPDSVQNVRQPVEVAAAPRTGRETGGRAAADQVTPAAPPPAGLTGVASPAAAQASAMEKSARHEAVAAPARELFGISITPAAFDRVRNALMSGARPGAEIVDVEALINYFAGPPARRPRREPALEVEASALPVDGAANRAVLRITVDTPAGAESSPIALEANLAVDFDRVTVVRARRIGDGDSLITEPILPAGASVTVLYELELGTPLLGPQRIATVRLRYSSLNRDGRARQIESVIRASDLVTAWPVASRRHRLATLGAVWSETLRGRAVVPDLARRAEELARQSPGDARARDLSDAAVATEREN